MTSNLYEPKSGLVVTLTLKIRTYLENPMIWSQLGQLSWH
jgi:hypothetical protein